MHLYNLTLSRASGIQAQELVVSRGKVLELLRPNESGKLQTIVATEVFGCIRSLQAFRMIGALTDFIVIGSDSGRIVILKFNKDKNIFQKVHQETYGRSGCRRIVPGQMIACDPKGRACMIAAVEKQKFVYVLNRDNAANLTISSPLEAHKSHTIVFSIVGMDMGFDNPVFAAIELDYGDVDQDPTGEAATEVQKHLTLYELDLGVNNVIRKWSDPVDNGANLLIAVPGGGDGPGGVLVCSENFIIYKNQDHADVRAVIPRRSDLLADRGVLVVCYATHKKKAYSFFLVQSEYGDIYKVTLAYEGDTVTEVKIKYFDTVPVCTSICVLKTGFLFAACEAGNHALYQFVGTGEDEDVESSSLNLMETEDGFQPVFFDPRPLKNLLLIDETSSLMPITDMKVANLLKEEIPQIYAVCGNGPRSTLAVLRPGLAVAELATAPLPAAPQSVFTIKRSVTEDSDAYIIVTFQNATLVFSIGDDIKECSDSGFLGTVDTMHTQLLADNSMLQVRVGGSWWPDVSGGIEGVEAPRLGHNPTPPRINEWKTPGRRKILHAASNQKQVAIALDGGEIIYFELDMMGQLLEERKRDMGEDILCMDVAPLQEGLSRSRFLVVGCADSNVRILGLDPEDGLRNLALQAVPSMPFSALFLFSAGVDEGPPVGGASEAGGLFLHVGLQNGVLTRTEVDRVTGQLSDTRSRFLGTRPPKLLPMMVRGQRSLLALSSRPWLGHSDQGRFNISPLSYEALMHASTFSSDQCPEGFVAIVNKVTQGQSQGLLKILAVENVGETFNQQVTRLRYTPRRLLVHPLHSTLFIAEADHAAIPLAQRADIQQRAEETKQLPVQGVEFDAEAAALEDQYGAPRGEPGQWAACLRIVDPNSLSTVFVQELDNNEAITSMNIVHFAPAAVQAAGGFPGEPLLIVGTARGLKYLPTECDAAYIRTYRISNGGKNIDLLHKTQLETPTVPGALVGFKGRLLAGVGSVLRIYELGKKKLLRKCEYKKLPHHIMSLDVQGGRIYVGDAQESVHLMKYKKNDNQLYCFADEASPRYLTTVLPIDYDTVAGADKFGNVFVARLPAEISAQVEDDPSGGKLSSVNGVNGANHKMTTLINFHVGDTITALQRASLQPGGQDIILYCTAMGAIGALYPFTSREDVDFFVHLEMHLRQEAQPLCGRDHMAFRSAYFPVKDVVDGDLCAQYPTLTAAKQRSIAEELERTPGEVLKKLEDIRNKIL